MIYVDREESCKKSTYSHLSPCLQNTNLREFVYFYNKVCETFYGVMLLLGNFLTSISAPVGQEEEL